MTAHRHGSPRLLYSADEDELRAAVRDLLADQARLDRRPGPRRVRRAL